MLCLKHSLREIMCVQLMYFLDHKTLITTQQVERFLQSKPGSLQ